MKHFSFKATTVVFLGLVLASCGSDSKGNASDPTADYVKECSSTKSLFETKDDYKTSTSSLMRLDNYESNALKGSSCVKITAEKNSVTALIYEPDSYGKITFDKSMQSFFSALIEYPEYAVGLLEVGNSVEIDKQTFDLNHKNTLFDMTEYNKDNALQMNLYVVGTQTKKYGYVFVKRNEGDGYVKFDFVEPTANPKISSSIADGVISITVDGALTQKLYLVEKSK